MPRPFLIKHMDINIRKGNINDLDALSLIEWECFPPEEAAGKKALEGRLRTYAGCFLNFASWQRERGAGVSC